MTKPLIALPCTAQELENALHAVCDHGLWDARIKVYLVNGDILKAMEGKPIRVLFKEDWGGSVADCTYIGHFMDDKFLKMSELIMVGIISEKEGDAK